MSKASRWARKSRRVMRFRERLSAYERHRHLVPLIATVRTNGTLELFDEHVLSPKEALRLARWIQEMFE